MSVRLELSAEQRGLVRALLAEHLPPGTAVWVFGSRASGRARRYSDLDLAIDAGRKLTLDEMTALREAFEESDLPYKTDIVDWHATDDRFRQLIAASRVALTEP